jgi:hypothetical protein
MHSNLTNERNPFIALTPYWNADLGKKGDKTPWSQNVRVQGVYNLVPSNQDNFGHAGGFAQYTLDYKKRDFLSNTKVRIDYVDMKSLFAGVSNVSASRLFVESTNTFRYLKNKMSRFVELRFFSGALLMDKTEILSGDSRLGLSLNGSNGAQDLFFENYYFGRNEFNGVWGAQREDNMGAFKTGRTILTNRWMATSNLYAQLPVKYLGFLGVFADFGAFGTQVDVEFAANVGLGMRLGDVFGIYFPLYSTDNIMQSLGGNYAVRIRFTLKMNLVNQLNLRKMIN